MKNFWDRPPTTSLEYFQCFDRARVLRHFRLYLINSTIHRDYTGKLGSLRFVRTLVKVKLETYLDTTQTNDSGLAIVRNMQLLSKKVTILQHNDRWNFSSYFTSKKLASMFPSNRLFELHLLRTNSNLEKIWKNNLNSSNSNKKQNPPNKRRWTMQRLWECLPKPKLIWLASKILWLALTKEWLKWKIYMRVQSIRIRKLISIWLK